MAAGEPRVDVERHRKYFERCFRTVLPDHFLSTEANRMYLGFLMLNAIDLVTPVPAAPAVAADHRRRLREWILANQSPAGGFCGRGAYQNQERPQQSMDIPWLEGRQCSRFLHILQSGATATAVQGTGSRL